MFMQDDEEMKKSKIICARVNFENFEKFLANFIKLNYRIYLNSKIIT
jgi:hypothetical protein